MEGRPSRSDEVLLETEVSVEDIKEDLAAVVTPLVSQLFERFDAESVSYDFVKSEVLKLTKARF